MRTPFSLEGRVAFVTGASSGIGAHFAQTLANAGAKVAIGARREAKLVALAEQIQKSGGRALPVVMDVTDAASIDHAISEVETELGPIGIVVNNAGIVMTAPALDLSPVDWNAVIDTDLKGAWLVAQSAARHMVKLGHGGSIINIGSILGLQAVGQVPAYSAAKAALHQLTRVLAVEWARHGIRVNALAPGYIRSDLNSEFLDSSAGAAILKRNPLRRAGEATELDGALLLLASDAGSYINGAVLVIDGGHSIAL
jgi:NAD(P)-dependent dehydrogenase (short-subunit alcohol dehydrogenase family)